MTFCPAAITTAALFTAIVLIDLAKGKYRSVPFHALGGFFCTLGISFICQTLGDTAAWILLSIPFIFILLGLFMLWLAGPTIVAEVQQTESCEEKKPICIEPTPPACTPRAPPPTLPASVRNVPLSTSISTLGCSKPPKLSCS